MCFGLAEAGLALSMASAVASFAQQSQAAAEQTNRYNQNRQNALVAARDEHNQTTLRAMQEREATNLQQAAQNIESAQRQADVVVSAAGAGVGGGLSVQTLLGDIRSKSARNWATLENNYKMTAQQLQQQQKGIVTKAESRINSVAPGNAPNPLGLLIDLGGAGVKYGREKGWA